MNRKPSPVTCAIHNVHKALARAQTKELLHGNNSESHTEEEARLLDEAKKQGLPAEELVLNAVRRLLPAQRNEEAIRALETVYVDGDEEEQRETLEYRKRSLDE